MLARDPRLARTLSVYFQCRELSLMHFERQVSKTKSEHVFVQWPSGWTVLPAAGGLDDQPCWTWDVMQKMLEGERKGRLSSATKRGA
jgi:hypothetical protein